MLFDWLSLKVFPVFTCGDVGLSESESSLGSLIGTTGLMDTSKTPDSRRDPLLEPPGDELLDIFNGFCSLTGLKSTFRLQAHT